MWASAPDAFEVLKKNSLLQKYAPKAAGLATKVGAYPINDPEGFYVGFAASGYGIMYNTRYLRANNLPAPKEWDDLKKPIYFGHVGISAPSRSGTTHLTVETILQGEGWDERLGEPARDRRQSRAGVRPLVRRARRRQQRPVRARHRHRLLRPVGQGVGLPGRVRLSDRDHAGAGQCRHHRRRQEPEGGGSLRRIPALRRRPADPARSEDPAPAGASPRSTTRRRPAIPIRSRTPSSAAA